MRQVLCAALVLLCLSWGVTATTVMLGDTDLSQALQELTSYAETASAVESMQQVADQVDVDGGMPKLVTLLESILADWKKQRDAVTAKKAEEETKCDNNAKSIGAKIKSSQDRVASRTNTINEQTTLISTTNSFKDRKNARISEVVTEIGKQSADLKSREEKLKTDFADKDAEIESYKALIEFLKSMQKEIKDGGLIESSAHAMQLLNDKLSQMSEVSEGAQAVAALAAAVEGDFDMDDVKELIALMIDELNKAISDCNATKERLTINFTERKTAITVVIKNFGEEKSVLEKEVAEANTKIASATTTLENAKTEKAAVEKEVVAFTLEQTANTDACTRTKGDLQKNSDTWSKKIALLEKILAAVKNANSNTKKKILDVVANVDISVPRWETSEWSACSVSCGTGVQTRTVTCAKSARSLKECKGDAPAASRSCINNPCPINCEVSGWGEWSSCTAQTCGAGTRSRTRTIVKNVAFGGTACPALTESATCSVPCPPKPARWVFFPHKDMAGVELSRQSGKSLSELKALCAAEAGCKAFNTEGSFKNALKPSTAWTNAFDSAKKGLYINTADWFCITPADGGAALTTPLRYNSAGEIECMSTNGRDCMWSSDMNACQAALDRTNRNDIRPLTCGAHHMSTYGMTGFENNNHWCSRTRALMATPKEEISQYFFVPMRDSGGNDITNLPRKTVDELMQWCTNERRCLGFNSNGWMKHSLIPISQYYQWTTDNKLGFYLNTHKWQCFSDSQGDLATPVRVGQDGVVECMSNNARDCFWQSNMASCMNLVNNVPGTLNPLRCDSASANNKNHWCFRIMNLLNPGMARAV